MHKVDLHHDKYSVQCNEGLALKLTLNATVKWYRRLIYFALTILFYLQFRFKCAYVTLLNPTTQSVHKVGYCPIIVFSHIEIYVLLFAVGDTTH